jgi:hypothetical protein
MVAEADGAFDPEAQGVIFYLYTRDLDALRARLLDGGVEAGKITTGGPGRTASSSSPIPMATS